MNYPSDGQWQKIAKFFDRPDIAEPEKSMPSVAWSKPAFYRLREGCCWWALSHDFPPWSTAASRCRLWRKRGVWQEAVLVLDKRWREVTLGCSRRAPRHAVLDRQNVRTAAGTASAQPKPPRARLGRDLHVTAKDTPKKSFAPVALR